MNLEHDNRLPESKNGVSRESLPKAVQSIHEQLMATGFVDSSSRKPSLYQIGTITAEDILSGYRKLDGGAIEFSLPEGVSVQEAGELLNTLAEQKGMSSPVFDVTHQRFWEENESTEGQGVISNRIYHFRIIPEAASKSRQQQVQDHGAPVSIGVVALAEACEKIQTENTASLLCDGFGHNALIRGATRGVVLGADSLNGVGVYTCSDSIAVKGIAFAASVFEAEATLPIVGEQFLGGFQKLDNGLISLSIPSEHSVVELAAALNAAAHTRGLGSDVFFLDDDARSFWEEHEANEKTRTTPGLTYSFAIDHDFVQASRDSQVGQLGELAPLAVVALAEGCQRLSSHNKQSIFEREGGNSLLVRCQTTDRLLYSFPQVGVDVSKDDGAPYQHVAAAQLMDKTPIKPSV